MSVEQLRAAVAALYTAPSSEEKEAADRWLRSFSSQEGAWRLLLALLSDMGAADYERFFAATSLRATCQRLKDATDPGTAPTVAQVLAQQLAAAAAAGSWHTANQLAATLTTVAVRAPSWPEQQLLQQLVALVQGALQACGGSTQEQQQLVLLRLLAFLAEAAGARELSMHPQRREAVRQALAAAPEPLATIQQVLATDGASPAVQTAAVELLQAWCGLGQPPAGAEASGSLWQLLHRAALQPDLGSTAAEAVAALYATLEASGSTDPQQAQRRHQVLCLLLRQLPGFAAALQQALGQSHGEQQSRLLYASLTILSAAAKAADSQQALAAAAVAAASAANPLLPEEAAACAAAATEAVHLAAELALSALQHPLFEVTLAALQHWDEQLERWQVQQQAQQQRQQGGGPSAGAAANDLGACNLQQRQALLGRLCGALLQRMELPASLPAAAATADARDLPDEVQLVRREVADTFRAAADCLGAQQTRQQLLQLAVEAQAAWQGAAAGGTAQPAACGWQRYECVLYALNLVWSRHRGQQQQQQHQADADVAAEVQQAATIAAAALHPAAPKLAGTALTLLGGMAEQLPLLLPTSALPNGQGQQEQQHGPVLHLLQQLLQLVQQAADEKLSRNAATCCYRLTGNHQLASMLAALYPSWGDALCGCFVSQGGMQQRAQIGEDLTTAQFLLVSICHLAVAAAAAAEEAAAGQSGGTGNGSSGSGGSELLQRLLSQPAAVVGAALDAATAAGTTEERQQQLEQAAMQLETIAVAIEAVAGSAGTSDGNINKGSGGCSSILQQLPALLGSLADVLQRAAATAAAGGSADGSQHHGPQQQQQQPVVLQAVCRVAAAMAPTPAASLGLHLLQPFIANPQHPCVLLTLDKLVAASSIHPAGVHLGQGLQAAAISSIQAAVAHHASDPDWQPAILLLGAACLKQLPVAAADDATLDALLAAAQHSMQSYHRDVCEEVLQFSETLCCIGCQQLPPKLQADGKCYFGGSLEIAAAQHHLQQRLDAGGLGPALLLGLLLAASGSMPPYMMVHIADALHTIWRTVGSDRFGAWFKLAALQLAPVDAPWKRWKEGATAAAVDDLLSLQCAQDARRFKRLLKVLCGGKKKGQHVDQPARMAATGTST